MTKPPLDPTDEDAFDTAKQWLLRGFQEHAGPDATWVADQVLDYKWHYFDQDLSSWTPDEVMAILLDRFPAKSSVDHADRPEVVAAFAAFLRWLGSASVLRSGDPEELAGFVEALAGPFMEAMADESKWGMAKRLFAQVAADGVDITDEASVQAWMQRFNSGSRAERDAILGPMPSGPAPDQRLSLPPVTLAPPERLTPAAEQSVWLRRVRDFVGFVGEGRPLTATGQLKLADGKALVDLLDTSDRVDEKIGDRVFRTQSSAELTQVDFTFRLARAAGYVKVIKKKVQPTRKASKLSDTLESWFALFETMTKIGLATHRWSQSHHNFGWWAEDLDQALPGMLTQLYAEGEPIWVNDLGTAFGDSLEQKYVFAEERFAELARDYATRGLRASLRTLAEHGAVALLPSEDEDDAETAWVKLTELGTWGLNRILAPIADAPVIGALSEASASELLNAAADLPADLATAEIDNWMTRQFAEAPALLVEALTQGGQATRGLALRALLRLGPSAGAAVDSLADDDQVWPYAWLWRVDALAGFDIELPFAGREECDSDVVALLHAALDVWGPKALDAWVARAAGPISPTELLGRIWRVRLPETEAVLAAIGGASGDRAVAKAARKALFRYRSVAG